MNQVWNQTYTNEKMLSDVIGVHCYFNQILLIELYLKAV